MSWLWPPLSKREPFTKSSPATSLATNWGISAGSVEPSASIITMMSLVHAAKPQARAFALPLAGLLHDLDVRPQLPRHLDGAVDGAAVDHDHLGDVGRQLGEDVRQVAFLVKGRDDNTYGR